MDKTIPMDELIDVDLTGYLEGEHDPNCVTEVFDLNGRQVD